MSQLAIAVRIARKVQEADEIFSLELVDANGSDLPAFEPGSHIDVQATSTIVRQYSLCNNPTERHRYLIGVLRETNSRGGSHAIADLLREGDLIRISSPRNLFPMAREQRHAVLLAGGIGITPILAMAEQLSRTGQSFDLHYVARSRSRMAFRDRILRSSFAARAKLYFDDGSKAGAMPLQNILASPDLGTHIYMCGPTGFIAAARGAAEERGWRPSQLHAEYFTPIETKEFANKSFNVRIASTGETYTIEPGQSVVDVLHEYGINIPISCEQGICGTCVTGLLSGVADHRDNFMTEEEHARNDRFTPCCSRAKSAELVLDL